MYPKWPGPRGSQKGKKGDLVLGGPTYKRYPTQTVSTPLSSVGWKGVTMMGGRGTKRKRREECVVSEREKKGDLGRRV